MERAEKTCGEIEMRALSPREVTELHGRVPGWSLVDRAIEREFRFKDFREAMAFVNKVATLSEAEGHHPDISISYSKVLLTLSTHKVSALSCRDFVLAEKIDGLAGSER